MTTVEEYSKPKGRSAGGRSERPSARPTRTRADNRKGIRRISRNASGVVSILAVGDGAQGPFSKAGPAFTTDWVEGPSAIRMKNEYYVYFDHYGNPKYYGAMKSADLEHWQDISPQVSFPRGTRHGTALRVPERIVRNLQHLETTKSNQP